MAAGDRIPTASDVAERAGVSTSTVSHVVNATRYVSPEVRGRVEASMRELGYEPNSLARALITRRSHTIGLVISDISNPFFTAVVRGVEDVAQSHRYNVVLCNSDEDARKEADYLRMLTSRRADGVILAPAGDRDDYISKLARNHFPLVFLDRSVPDVPASSVMVDGCAAARDAMRHLLALGHSHVGLVAGRRAISSTRVRLEGCRIALEEAGLPFDERLIAWGESKMQEARAETARLLAADPRPSAFFAMNNLMTLGTLAAIRDCGMTVPDDVALVGFDDFVWAELFSPRLTTVSQPTYELGRTAAELLLEVISHDTAVIPRQVLLPGTLIVRDSSGVTARKVRRAE